MARARAEAATLTEDSGTIPALAPVTEVPQRWYWTLVAVLLLGVLAVAQLLWTSHATGQRVIQQLKTTNAIRQLEVHAALSHLWLMEFLSGDASVEIEEVWSNLDRSLALVQRVLQGDSTELGGDALQPLRDPELRRRADSLRTQLSDLRTFAVERHRQGEQAGVGTDMDQRFDEMFLRLLDGCEELCRRLEAQVAASQIQTRQRLALVIAAWIVIVLAAVVVLWLQEQRRRGAERAVRKGQMWLSTTLAGLEEGVVSTGLDGTVVFINDAAQRLTGWTSETATGRRIEEVFKAIGEEDGRPLDNPALKVLAGGAGTETLAAVLVDRAGGQRYIEQAAAPIRDSEGALLGALLMIRDITERREAEASLRQRESELRQAQKMEALGRLAGGIAHDINNYLGAIRGYCEVARMDGLDDEARARRLDAAMETASEASALIRQLLAFSRKQPDRSEVVDVNRVVARTEGMMRQLLGEDIALTTSCTADLWKVRLDPSQAEQILVNLLVNSRDAMPQGGDILVSTRNVQKSPEDAGEHPALAPGSYAVLAVRDTGIGMPPEIQQKIFEPFFTTRSEAGSSGLGLATVYGIVQQNGGFIAVDSRPGRGTSIEVYLLSCSGLAVSQEAPAGDEDPLATDPAKVLLVEDNQHMRNATESLLRALGHDVVVASDGEQALRLLAAERPPLDLLITDVVMPGLSGPELLSRIREEREDIRCIFISGYTDSIILRHGLDQERSDFLQKPFTARGLSRKIGEILSSADPTPVPRRGSPAGGGSDISRQRTSRL